MCLLMKFRFSDNNRSILALAVPSIVANITTPLLGLVDTAVTGHIGSAVYLAAIAIGGSMFNMLYWLFAFLRMGSSGMTAQACGRGDMPAAALILYRAMLVAAVAGTAIILLRGPIASVVVRFMDADAATSGLAVEYFRIVVFGAPAVLGTYALSGWFLGMQNSRASMTVSIIINVVNIFLSVVLVFGFGMKLAGVAAGTLVAQWVGLGAGAVMCRRYRVVWPGFNRLVDWKELRRFFSINIDIFLRTLCLVAVTMWFTRAGARQGDVMLAVNALLMQLFMLFSYMMDGFAFAGEALAGRYVGAGDTAMLRLSIRNLFRWGVAVSAVFTLMYVLFGDMLLSMLTSDRDVIAATHGYFLWAVAFPVAGMSAFIWDGVFIGATMTRSMLASMAVSVAVFFGLSVWLYPSLGNHALWLAFVMYLAVRGLVQTVLFFKSRL